MPAPTAPELTSATLRPLVHHRADLLGQMIDAGGIERPVRTGQDAGPDLDDPGLRRQNDVVAHQVARVRRSPAAHRRRPRSRRERSDWDRCSVPNAAVPELQLA